jgi:hypothetical protein
MVDDCFKVADEDNIFLRNIMVVECVKRNEKGELLSVRYIGMCKICGANLESRGIMDAKYEILMHIVREHRNIWVGHRGKWVR